jgi:hypothetical protein
MSYDLRIFTSVKQNYEELITKLNAQKIPDGFILPLKNSQITVFSEIVVDDEDIPTSISCQLPGIQYLIECSLEPYTTDKKQITELIKLAKQIAQNGHGVIEDPQTDETILPSGIKRVTAIEKTERFSAVILSWWFNHGALREEENLIKLLNEMERTVPEALPRRYGLYEPPQDKFSSKDEFVSFLKKNIDDTVVWYPSKPVIDVNLVVPKEIGPEKWGYRFSHLSIEIDSAVLTMPGWRVSINRFFKNISQLFDPFYGDMRIIHQLIRWGNNYGVDGETEDHPIVGGAWNGMPRKSGFGLVLGDPLLDHVKYNKDYLLLNNGCKLIIEEENVNLYRDLEIPDDLYQPQKINQAAFGFTGRYCKLWPFEGPKIVS